jgi:hypothetical protein
MVIGFLYGIGVLLIVLGGVVEMLSLDTALTVEAARYRAWLGVVDILMGILILFTIKILSL